jgi:hypothetical protein
MLKKTLAGALSVLLVAAGLVFGLAAPASAHTGDLNASAECIDGEYHVTYTLTISNTNLSGTSYWRVGTTSFEGTPGSNAGMSNSVATAGSNNYVLTTITLPGNSTQAPWAYAYSIWSDNYSFGSDGGDIQLGGDCQNVEPIYASGTWASSPPTCTTGEALIVNNGQLVNATWTAGALSKNGSTGPAQFDITATAIEVATWSSGNGTFHVVLAGPLGAADCVSSATVKIVPPTCLAPGGVAPDSMVNATFAEPVYQNGQYTIVATRTGGALFPNPGQDGVSADGTTKTFTGPIAPQLTEGCVASAAIVTYPGNCTETGTVAGGAISNAIWGGVTYENGQYTIVATRTGVALFPNPGQNGVSADGTTKTFTGPVPPTDPAQCKIDGPKKPWVKDGKCVEGQPSDGSIQVFFGELGDKIKFEITGGDLQQPITILFGDSHTVALPPGNYTVTAIAIAPWVFEQGATTSWNRTIDEGKCKVYPEPALYNGEQCVDGETAQGWIAVDYSGYLPQQIQYRITGPNGFDEVVVPDGDWTYVDLDAGTYTVTVETLHDWVKVKNDNFPVEITITSATNCVCYVPPSIEKDQISALGDINPVCAEAEVSVTPPTCFAAGTLKLGDVLSATWGEPVIENGHYTATATADEGTRFAPGDGVSEDGFTKTFEGDLPAQLKNCDLTTLALTGAGDGGGLLWGAGLVILLGLTAVVAGNRRKLKVEKQQ